MSRIGLSFHDFMLCARIAIHEGQGKRWLFWGRHICLGGIGPGSFASRPVNGHLQGRETWISGQLMLVDHQNKGRESCNRVTRPDQSTYGRFSKHLLLPVIEYLISQHEGRSIPSSVPTNDCFSSLPFTSLSVTVTQQLLLNSHARNQSLLLTR